MLKPCISQVSAEGYWTPDFSWEKETVFIIGGGPSLIGFNWDLVSSFKTIGCNDAYLLGDWVDVVLFGDSQWFKHHREALRRRAKLTVGIVNNILDADWVRWMRRSQRDADWCEPFELPWFGNTGVAAVSLAISLGATRIRLLGFDMAYDSKGNSNWHPNIAVVKQQQYDYFIEFTRIYARWLEVHIPEVEILNCNPSSRLDVWKRVSLEEALGGYNGK